MPFVSQAQAGWAFANKKPFARRWARQTGPYKRLPYKKRKKAFTIQQLEAFVSSPHYDAATAGAIAAGIPALKAAGAPGELLSPGVRRIHGNLCNVHGRYGPCDKALSGKKKPAKGRKPAKTDAQRAAERIQRQGERQAETTRQQALNLTKVADDTGLGDNLANLNQFGSGKPIRPQDEETLIKQGLMERGADGAARMTEQGRVLLNAAKRGDTQRARDAMSRGRDQVSAGAGRAKRRQDTAGKRAVAQIDRELAKRARAEASAKKPAKASAGGRKQIEAHAQAAERPRAAKPKRAARQSAPIISSAGGSSKPKPKPAAPKPEKAPAKQIVPALQTAADQLSQGAELSDDDTQALIRNGLAKLNKDGTLVLTAAGMRATTKAYSFRVFKDANGQPRWIAQSSTAFQDRDREIVSTKALSDDCAFADASGSYGPLRWWHTPGIDLGDCDFNAMHGRVLIESGTFRSPLVAQKIAQAANGLEISLGFLHLPNEPDGDGVFHHIRRFERSLVPRGKASNRFTAFTVKETRMFDPTKVAALKQLGFSDADITNLQAQAAATEKAATDQGVAFKANEPAELPDVIINGITYKAFPPAKADEGSPEEEAAESPEEEAAEPDAMDEEPADENALTLSAGDLAAIQGMIGNAMAQIMGGLDLEKKVAGHVAGFLAPIQQAQTTKDAEQAQAKEQLTALTKQVAELTGDQPTKVYRPSAAPDNVLTDAAMLAAAKQLADPNSADPWADIKRGLGLSQS